MDEEGFATFFKKDQHGSSSYRVWKQIVVMLLKGMSCMECEDISLRGPVENTLMFHRFQLVFYVCTCCVYMHVRVRVLSQLLP